MVTEPTDAATRMVRAAVVVLVVLGIPAVALAWWLRGPAGAGTAAGTILLTCGGFILSGLSLRWALARSPAAVQATMLGGLLLRLTLYGILLAVLLPTELVDKPTLVTVAVTSLAVLLAVEVRLVTANPEFRMIHPAEAEPHGKDHQ
ncbi:hypothetical protein [Salsipaludibacter albus]|uniref:hypothetical protein n=1 Tax=Salsipaludibacter albus TaxID=2849650 RepID=UPI001EE3F46F|nr:hypothetical protein [Salsipaludibacter albus]MBY5163363.1 hypothetical protein [Salsipaludibacter albus]